MKKTTTRKNDKTAKIAAPVRDFLRKAIREKIQTPADRQKLAKFLGQAPSSVGNLLKGEGGMDTWIAALVFCYGIDSKSLTEMIQDFQTLARKHRPTESDRLAAQIVLPESKRRVLFSALLTALSLDSDLRREPALESVPLWQAAEPGNPKDNE